MSFSYKRFTYFSGLIICLSTLPVSHSFASNDFKYGDNLFDDLDYPFDKDH